MRALLQRVLSASVVVDGQTIGEIGPGLVVLLGVTHSDTEADATYLVEKIPNLRIFDDPAGKMNLSLADLGHSILVVSQFTLYGDARRGRRPGFDAAARPEQARPLYEFFVEALRRRGIPTETGRFQAEMHLSLVNHGPVTLFLDSAKEF